MSALEMIKKNYWLDNLIAGEPKLLSVIQSLVVIATFFVYNSDKNLLPILAILVSSCLAYSVASISKKWNLGIKPWHFTITILSIILVIIFSDTLVHAQILDGVEGAIDEVGEAAGGSFSEDVLAAVIEIIRIAIFIVIAGAIILAIFFGVSQNQWQIPVLVVSVIIGVGLFLEIMGQVIFG